MILLLISAVILPTVCLLWFMTQAVKNERLAVKQKLIDLYTKRAEYFFVEVQESYPFDHYVRPVHVQAEIPPYHANPYILFNLLTSDMDRCAGMLIYDSNGMIEYPVLEYDAGGQGEDLALGFEEELNGDFEEAITGYEIIGEESADEIVRYKAMLGKARCLLKLDRLQEAIDVVYELSYRDDYEEVESSVAAMIMHNRVLLAELYGRSNDEKLSNHILMILGYSHYNNEKENPYLPTSPAETIVWQLDELIAMAEEAGLSDELEREIESARGRIAAYENSIEIAQIFSNASLLKDWPDQNIRKLSLESEFYGLKFPLADKTILMVCRADRILWFLRSAVDDMEDDTVGVKVFDNFGNVVGGDGEIEAEPFLTLVPGK